MNRRAMLRLMARRYPLHVIQSASCVGNVWTVTLQHEDGGPASQLKVYRRNGLVHVETQNVWRSKCSTSTN